MGDENPIRTLGDYSKPSHEGYRNTIELPVGNNVVPLRSDTIRLVQNGCSFHGLRSKDPNQHLKDFLKLMDSIDLDGKNRERMPLRRTAKLRNDILMFQQHHGESLSEAWTRFKDLLQNVPHHGIDPWLQVQTFYDHVNSVTRRTIDQNGRLIVKTNDDSYKEEPEVGEQEVEYFDIFPTRSELAYHKYFRVSNPAYVLRNPILKEGCPLNLKIPCNIRHVHVEKA
ncbi:zinc finger, CCHC-type containing protein [Tanacetum coccineum]